MFAELKYKIADLLFTKAMDEAFASGIRAGRESQASKLRVVMDYKKNRSGQIGMTKTQAIGYERCMEVVANAIR